MGTVILIASSDEAMRRRWRRAVAQRFAVSEVPHWPGLVRSMADLKPELLLLDRSLPRLGGVRGVAAIRGLSPQTRIVVLTRNLDEREGVTALKAGVRGYCHSNLAPGLLQRAVERVQEGEIWAGRRVLSRLVDDLASHVGVREVETPARWIGELDRLSSRQQEIARLVSGGASNREIASHLGITEKTVKAYLTAVFQKLGLSRRVQLALLVTEDGRHAPRRATMST